MLSVTVALSITGILLARRPAALGAHDAEPTYAQDVAPILYKNCTMCHRPGGIGSFSLLDYDSTVKNIEEMRDAVSTGQMPPWQAEGPHGVFRNDRRLSSAEKETILRWIDGGAKPGDLSALPKKPEYPDAWNIGTPDAIYSMPEEFPVPATGTVEYMYFEVPTNLTEDKWVQAIEVMPGARDVVHHVLVFAKVPPKPSAAPATAPAPAPSAAPSPTQVASAPGSGATAAPAPRPQPLLIRNPAYDIKDEPKRLDTLHAPPRVMGSLIGTTAPGTNVVEFPKGTAMRLRAGTVLTFQMHYTAKGHAMMDRSRVGFKFAKEMPEEEIYATHFYNGAMVLPAGAKDYAIPADIGVSQPIKVWGLFPHTHLRGKKWQYSLLKPDGTSEVVLDVPRYDFNWQTYYLFDKPLEMPAGSKLLATAWYDNSASNKHNPDPTKEVRWGDQTWEEMQYTGLLYSVPGRKVVR